jgi:hypothetical protein
MIKRDLPAVYIQNERLARELLRAGLRAVGVGPKRATDLLRRVPTKAEEDQHRAEDGELFCFARDELIYGDGRTARTRSTAEEREKAFRLCFPKTTLKGAEFHELLSLLLQAGGHEWEHKTFRQRGRRVRGWVGVGVKLRYTDPVRK